MERQSEAFIWIALLMIFLSAGLAWLLAYTLGRPLKRITTAAKALAVGRYDIRLPVESTDELGQLARDFNDMAAALEQSEQARRRWVADISHELRTPLAVLRGVLTLTRLFVPLHLKPLPLNSNSFWVEIRTSGLTGCRAYTSPPSANGSSKFLLQLPKSHG